MKTINAVLATVLLAGLSCVSHADTPSETGVVLTIDEQPGPHWVWVTDINYPSFIPGRAHLVDAGTGRHIGMLSMGMGLSPLGLPRDGHAIFTVETHYDRTTRGNRFDFVGVYDPKTLNITKEIEIPSKKLSSVPMINTVAMTDDDRFMLIYNFTPAQSASVVDLKTQEFVGEIESAGCGMVLAGGARRFLMMCGDGSLLDIRLSDEGKEVSRAQSTPIFDPDKEFVTEKAVRYGSVWLFVSNGGEIREVDLSKSTLGIQRRWSLFSDAEHKAGWRIGGQQHLAVHVGSGMLYAAVHQGDEFSHKHPGTDIFVYSIDTMKRSGRITLERPGSAIQVTQDDKALLLTTNAYPPVLDVYDAKTGKLLREIGEVAVAPMLLQTPVGAPSANQGAEQ